MAKKKSTQNRFHKSNRGLTIAYIGNGKGKTTAAVGMATRAAGHEKKILFFQFLKSEQWPSGERIALKKIRVDVCVRGRGFVGILNDRQPRAVHQRAAARALSEARKLLLSGKYQLVILDELISCVERRLLTVGAVTKLLDDREKNVKARKTHVVMTGHNRYPGIVRRCDLVTEMKMVRHPYDKGIFAIRGLDY